MKVIKLKIKGMHCSSCEVLIEQNFKKISGVEKVSVNSANGKAVVYASKTPTLLEFQDAINENGYTVSYQNETCEELGLISKSKKDEHLETGAIFVVMTIMYLFLKQADLIPIGFGVSQNMSYGFIFLIGLVAAVSSCIAVTGGLLLAVAAKYNEKHAELQGIGKFKPHLYFNIGRIFSYTLLGGLVGLLGSTLTISPRINGILVILVSVVMIMLGFQLLKIFPSLRFVQLKMPKFLAHKIHNFANKDGKIAPFFLGTLTFFLPCGFTQALQLYVLSTGDFVTGALTMLTFSLGTLPALLSLSAISSFSRGVFQQYFLKFAGVLVILLGIFNINNGLVLTGVNVKLVSALQSEAVGNEEGDGGVKTINGKQIVEMKVEGLTYSPSQFTVKKDIPVEWQIDGSGASGCAQVIIIPELGITKYLSSTEITTISFTPQETGAIPFSCSMGMTTRGASFIVVENDEDITLTDLETDIESAIQTSAVATNPSEVQKLAMEISREKGFYPNVFYIKKDIPVELTIDDKVNLGGCMGVMTIPEYDVAQLLKIGINTIQFTPTETGVVEAACSMGIVQATFYVS